MQGVSNNVYNFKTISWTSEDFNEANIVFIAFLKRVQIASIKSEIDQ